MIYFILRPRERNTTFLPALIAQFLNICVNSLSLVARIRSLAYFKMPQMKARKTVESLRSRPRLHRMFFHRPSISLCGSTLRLTPPDVSGRTRDIIPIDIDVAVTCNSAKITQTHLSSQQCISNPASTTHIDADTDAGARACTFTDVCDILHLPKVCSTFSLCHKLDWFD